MKDASYFKSTPQRAVKTISTSPSPRNVPSTSVRKPSGSAPAPLVMNKGCASCNKRRR